MTRRNRMSEYRIYFLIWFLISVVGFMIFPSRTIKSLLFKYSTIMGLLGWTVTAMMVVSLVLYFLSIF